MNNIEKQLSALKPAGQSDLARRILAVPQRRRQRRRDCLVGLGGLLTGIAATLLVVLALPDEDKGTQTAVQLNTVLPAEVSPSDVFTPPSRLSPALPPGGRQPTLNAVETNFAHYDSIDLDELIARYEMLLKNRPAVLDKPAVYTPVSFPGGIPPLEYRKQLLKEIGC